MAGAAGVRLPAHHCRARGRVSNEAVDWKACLECVCQWGRACLEYWYTPHNDESCYSMNCVVFLTFILWAGDDGPLAAGYGARVILFLSLSTCPRPPARLAFTFFLSSNLFE